MQSHGVQVCLCSDAPLKADAPVYVCVCVRARCQVTQTTPDECERNRCKWSTDPAGTLLPQIRGGGYGCKPQRARRLEEEQKSMEIEDVGAGESWRREAVKHL